MSQWGETKRFVRGNSVVEATPDVYADPHKPFDPDIERGTIWHVMILTMDGPEARQMADEIVENFIGAPYSDWLELD